MTPQIQIRKGLIRLTLMDSDMLDKPAHTKSYIHKYRNRANNGRSRLMAAPLTDHAKTHFLCAFYVVISRSK